MIATADPEADADGFSDDIVDFSKALAKVCECKDDCSRLKQIFVNDNYDHDYLTDNFQSCNLKKY